MGAAWTEERVDRLTAGWRDGLSASLIAADLGGFEHCADGGRSAVIGKLHRLGLCRPKRVKTQMQAQTEGAVTQRLKRKLRQRAEQVLPPQDDALVRIQAEIPPPEFLSIPLLDLTSDQCRWPRGEGASITFCGQPRIADSSYCAACYRKSVSAGMPAAEAVE